jgi:hypothetical protein
MNTALHATCLLCEKAFPRARLHMHILAERPLIRHGTIEKIKAQFPGWIHGHGACLDCWKKHRSLALAGFLEATFGTGLASILNASPGWAKPS